MEPVGFTPENCTPIGLFGLLMFKGSVSIA